jgi:hypothetical protein
MEVLSFIVCISRYRVTMESSISATVLIIEAAKKKILSLNPNGKVRLAEQID